MKFVVLARVLHEVVTCVADGRFEGTPEVLSTSLTAVPARNRAAVGPVRVAPLEPIGIEGGRVLRRSTVYPYRAPPHGAGRGQSAAGSVHLHHGAGRHRNPLGEIGRKDRARGSARGPQLRVLLQSEVHDRFPRGRVTDRGDPADGLPGGFP